MLPLFRGMLQLLWGATIPTLKSASFAPGDHGREG